MAMEFLTAVTAKEAHRLVVETPVQYRTERVLIDRAVGRVTAEDVVSREAIPAFPRSLVDGYAVISKDIQGARETTPAFLKLSGEIRIGEKAHISVREGNCVQVSTGSMVPEGADGVVMQEYVRVMDGEIEVTRPVHRGENVVYEGEDISEGSIVVPRGRRIGPFDAGAFAAIGSTEIQVFARPRVALLSSGDEIVPVEGDVPLGKVRDINRYTVTALLETAGADVEFAGHARDSVEDITGRLSAAGGHDLILISGGSSKGERDYITASVLALDGEVVFHGINVRPGKPSIFGRLFGKPFFGLPGHPVSCAMVTIRFVLPLVKRMAGEEHLPFATWNAVLTVNVPSSYGVEEYVRVRLEKDGDTYMATPVFAKSSVISSLSGAHGYIVVPEGVEGLEKGEPVEVRPFG